MTVYGRPKLFTVNDQRNRPALTDLSTPSATHSLAEHSLNGAHTFARWQSRTPNFSSAPGGARPPFQPTIRPTTLSGPASRASDTTPHVRLSLFEHICQLDHNI